MTNNDYTQHSILLVFIGILCFAAGVNNQNVDYWNKIMSRESMQIGNNYSLDTWKRIYYYNSIQNTIIQNLAIRPEKKIRVLDVGTGHGTWAFFMKSLYPKSEVVGIDIADTLRVQWSRFQHIKFLVADIADSSLDIGKFDIIIAIGVIHHIVKPERLSQAIENMSNMLNDKGQIFIATEFPNKPQRINRYKVFQPLSYYRTSFNKYGLSIKFIDNEPFGKNRTQNDVIMLEKK